MFHGHYLFSLSVTYLRSFRGAQQWECVLTTVTPSLVEAHKPAYQSTVTHLPWDLRIWCLSHALMLATCYLSHLGSFIFLWTAVKNLTSKLILCQDFALGISVHMLRRSIKSIIWLLLSTVVDLCLAYKWKWCHTCDRDCWSVKSHALGYRQHDNVGDCSLIDAAASSLLSLLG